MSLFKDDHINLLRCFLDRNVKFIVIGGHAAIYYGVRRSTGDLDILIEPSANNGHNVIKALTDAGLEVPEIKSEEFETELVLSFGLEPDAVDILNFAPGINFEKAYANSVLVDFMGLPIRMIDLRDLIKNKENLQRKGDKSLLDKYDVEVLKKILKKKEGGSDS